MPSDPYYSSRAWQQLRQEALLAAGFQCSIPGCFEKNNLTVDHIISRRDGGADDLSNLRVLCRSHDARIRQTPKGQRRNSGKTFAHGSDASGWPIDPNHPWNKEKPLAFKGVPGGPS